MRSRSAQTDATSATVISVPENIIVLTYRLCRYDPQVILKWTPEGGYQRVFRAQTEEAAVAAVKALVMSKGTNISQIYSRPKLLPTNMHTAAGNPPVYTRFSGHAPSVLELGEKDPPAERLFDCCASLLQEAGPEGILSPFGS